MRFFLDNCTSPHHARGLSEFGRLQRHEIVHLREKFPPDISDVDWISALGAEGDWIIVSGDTRITRNPTEKAAWHQSGLTAFFFAPPWATDNYWVQAAALVLWWPDIVLQARNTPSGHGFLLQKSGAAFRQIYPELPNTRGRRR